MKKIVLVLFTSIFLIGYSCKPAMIDYLKEANVLEDSRNLVLYEDSRENYNYNLIFKLENDLYVYGKKFLTVNDKSYVYLGNGYYKNGETIYFFNREVTKIKGVPKIKISVKVQTSSGMEGTSCEGVFKNYTYYLEVDGVKFKNDKKEESILNLFMKAIESLKNLVFL